jgi:excisionase family DNA binding protein
MVEADMNRLVEERKAVLVLKPEAAELLGISLRMLDYLIARGEVKTVRLGTKRRLVPRGEIDRIVRTAR